MAYSDPQSVKIGTATADSLARTSSGTNAGSFSKDDSTVVLKVSHQTGNRVRRTARLEHSKVAPDPLFPAQNKPYGMTVYIVVDVPPTGYTIAEQRDVAQGLTTWLNTPVGGKLPLTQLLGGEN